VAFVLVSMLGIGIAPAASSRWWSRVEFLASDAMLGRQTGSATHRLAAGYVAAEFRTAGLEAAGTDEYFQPIDFRSRRIVEAQSSLALVRDGRTEPLALGVDANVSMRVDPAAAVDAPIVFVGHGLRIPELKIDDFTGVSLKGAVVVYLTGTPRSLSGALQAHFNSNAERWRMYREAGAVGTIGIARPVTMEIPWERATLARLQPQLSLADPALDEYPDQQIALSWNPDRAERLFAGSGHTFAELLELADADRPLPHFAIPARVQATVRAERSTLESQNVAGILRGADPRLRDEFVVVSAHLDHIGSGPAVGGDAIYNGAMDNASGVAALLEVALRLHEEGARPARSLLFLVVTGEEDGELGSRYFIRHPTVPRPQIVADVNIDMFLPLFPLKTLMVLGLDESDLGRDIRAVARAMGVGVQADPEPRRLRFVRSDQYSFVTAGIPALAMKVGYDPDTPEAAVAAQWTAGRYHAPSDDPQQPVDLAAGDRYIDAVRALAVAVANRVDRPGWIDGSVFKRFHGID
jgi:hypothetical protein